MRISLGLPNRPFTAIKNGTKKVEGRVTTSDTDKYKDLKTGDIITFTNEDTGEFMDVNIKFVHHYKDTRSMLETEGVENVLSSEPKTIEAGIEGYHKLYDYEKNIPLFGIYAIGVKPRTFS